MNAEACHWCGQPSVRLVTVERALSSGRSVKRPQNRLARQLPACEDCARQLALHGTEVARWVAEARQRYWQRRQGRLC